MRNNLDFIQLIIVCLFYRKYLVYRMFRAIPTNNKLCFDKQLKRSWKIHEDKLRTIKSSINKRPPQHYTFLDQRAKRSALQDVRNIEIEKQNQALLTKMKTIGQKGNNTSYLKNSSLCEKKKTLNEGFRKRQLVKIVEENQDIIKRIYEKKSVFNVRKWQKQRKEIQKKINMISSYPYKDYPVTHTLVNLWMVQDDDRKTKTQNLSMSKTRLRRHDLLFSGTHKIGNSFYLIETAIVNKTFKIEVENLERMDQKFRLQMSQNKAIDMLDKNFNGAIQNMFNCLEIDESKGVCELKCFLQNQQTSSKSRKNLNSQIE